MNSNYQRQQYRLDSYAFASKDESHGLGVADLVAWHHRTNMTKLLADPDGFKESDFLRLLLGARESKSNPFHFYENQITIMQMVRAVNTNYAAAMDANVDADGHVS